MVLVKGDFRNRDSMLQKSPCARFGELGRWMDAGKIFAVTAEPFRFSASHLHCRIGFEGIEVIVRTQIEFDQFGELADLRGEMTLEAEVGDVHEGHTAVGMQLDSRLVAPEVRGLVEIPVDALCPVFSRIRPGRAVKRLPDVPQGIVVLHVGCRFVHRHRHVDISDSIVHDREFHCHRRLHRFQKASVSIVEDAGLD